MAPFSGGPADLHHARGRQPGSVFLCAFRTWNVSSLPDPSDDSAWIRTTVTRLIRNDWAQFSHTNSLPDVVIDVSVRPAARSLRRKNRGDVLAGERNSDRRESASRFALLPTGITTTNDDLGRRVGPGSAVTSQATPTESRTP